MVGAEALVVAAQGRREIEAEAVHVHLLDPVPQRGEDQVHHMHRARIQGAAGPGDVEEAAVIGPVVLEAVQAAQGEGGPVGPALGGVVVDHVEDDLETGRVQAAHHGLDLVDHGLRAGGLRGRRGQRRLRGEERQRRVAPVVRQPQPRQMRLVHRRMDGQQLEAGHPEAAQIAGHRRMAEPRVGAALLRRERGMLLGEALDVQLVQHGGVPVHERAQIVLPVEGVGDHDGPHGVLAVVHLVTPRRVADPVEHRVDLEGEEGAQQRGGVGDAPRPGVQQQLVRGAQQPRRGIPGAIDPQPVPRPGGHPGDVIPVQAAVEAPQPLAVLGHPVADAQVHGLGPRCGDGEGSAALRVDDEPG